jgi:hypothetical protein
MVWTMAMVRMVIVLSLLAMRMRVQTFLPPSFHPPSHPPSSTLSFFRSVPPPRPHPFLLSCPHYPSFFSSFVPYSRVADDSV